MDFTTFHDSLTARPDEVKSLDDFLGRCIDMAGPESRSLELSKPWMSEIAVMMEKARDAGLKITYHVGESPGTGPEGMLKLIEAVRPDRIGHGIELRHAEGKLKDRLVTLLHENAICLELCPTVNLVTRVIPDS